MRFHRAKLPNHSTLLVGREPPDEVGFRSDLLQIWFNHSDSPWQDDGPHAHLETDECFIVLTGQLVVEVEGERLLIGPREFMCFPRGLVHHVVEVRPPVETFMIRSASVDDKSTA